MAEDKASKDTSKKDDSPPQNKHGVGTTQTTPKKGGETRVSATDPGHKDHNDKK